MLRRFKFNLYYYKIAFAVNVRDLEVRKFTKNVFVNSSSTPMWNMPPYSSYSILELFMEK